MLAVRERSVLSTRSNQIRNVASKINNDSAIYNAFTSVGVGKDSSHNVLQRTSVPLLSYEQLRTIYRHTALARKAVDRPVRDVMSRPFRIDVNGKDITPTPRWLSETERLDARATVMRAAQWARAFGAARIVLDVDDGKPFSEPLGTYTKINQLLVFDGFQLRPETLAVAGSEKVGAVQSYRLHEAGQKFSAIDQQLFDARWRELLRGGEVHASRVFVICGNALHDMDWDSNRPEGDSVIQTFWRELCHRLDLSAAAAVLAVEARIDGIKSPTLEANSVGEGAERYHDRLEELAVGKTLLNMLLLGNGEEYFSRQIQLNGIADLAKVITQAWCAAAEIPASIFFEEATAGMSGSDNPEASTYADMKNALWVEKIAPAWEWLAKKIVAQDKRAARPRSVAATLETAQTESPKDTMARYFMLMQTASMAVGAKVIPPSYASTIWQGPTGLTFNMPPYEPGKYPWPAPEEAATEAGSGNQNGAGQVPVTAVEKPTGGAPEALYGADPRSSATNTGEENKL